MKTTMRFEGPDRSWTYEVADCPFLPEGSLVTCAHVAAARVVSNYVIFNEDDTVEQWVTAK